MTTFIFVYARTQVNETKTSVKQMLMLFSSIALRKFFFVNVYLFMMQSLLSNIRNNGGISLKYQNSNSHLYRDEASSHRSKDTHHMIQIFIKTPINPKTLCLRLDHKTTVSDLKDIIHRKLAIRPALQNLYTNNKRFKVWST